MQVSSINTNQTNFRGQIIFREQCIKLGKNIQAQNCLAIPSESVKLLADVGEPTQTLIETRLAKLSANVRKMYTVALQKYKTVILTATGDNYIVTADCKKISEAKQKVDGTSKFIEI